MGTDCMPYSFRVGPPFRNMDVATGTWAVAACVAGMIFWAALCKAFYSVCGQFGKDLVSQNFGQRTFYVVDGDFSSNLIYEEIFLKKVYFKAGISLDDRAAKVEGPLVIDVGGNVGFFSAFVAEHYKTSRPE